MKPSTKEVRKEFIALWSRLARSWGISSATSKVYAWLLSQPNGGGTDDIMSELKLGRGTVSMACKELREWGLIVADQRPGERRIRYRVETDLGKVIRNIILHRKRREWDPILEQTATWIPRLEEDRSPEAGVFRERLRAIRTCLGLADTMALSFLQGDILNDLKLDDFSGAGAARQPKDGSGEG